MTPAATVPGTPTSVTGAAGNAQVTVAWTAPASIGESPITGYRVQVATSAAGSYSNATGCATNSTTASCTATGLTNGTAYFFKVAAINGAGTGVYSAASSGVTPVTVPGVPASVATTAANTQVTVTWTAPANGGSAITGYQVQLGTTSGGPYSNTACATNSTTASCTATGLTTGTAYFFRVAAINAVGTGAYSAESMAVPGPPATGTPDTTFTINLGTGFNNGVYAVAMQGDGKIVVSGNFTTLNGVASNRVARLNADGTPDTTFTTNVGTGFNDFVFSVAVQADGKILAGGSFTTLNGASRNRIARLNADGTPDTTFATNVGTGFDNSAKSVAVQGDGKIVVGGLFTTLNGTAATASRASMRMAPRTRRSRPTSARASTTTR